MDGGETCYSPPGSARRNSAGRTARVRSAAVAIDGRSSIATDRDRGIADRVGGVGDGIELLKRKLGISSYAAVAKWIEALLEGEPETRVEPRIDYRARAEWTWDHGEPIGDSGAAVDHFRSRGINLPRGPSNLRTWNRLLLAKITSPEGEFLSVHVRSLRAREKWRSMRGSYEAGSVVRLWKPKDGVLGIAEGIETAMSAAMIFHIPVWSALSASGIAAFKSAPNVTTLIIFADNDENGAGQQAAETARARLAPSHHSVEVRTPERVGWDWNDVIMRETCNRENVA